jgi:cephalosporin hydroxylase
MNNQEFFKQNSSVIEKLGNDKEALSQTRNWMEHVSKFEYSYHFTWMGIPIIQFPQDIVAIQEIIWNRRFYFV